ncbi:MAG: deaminase [Burkholderiaceae bacterium]
MATVRQSLRRRDAALGLAAGMVWLAHGPAAWAQDPPPLVPERRWMDSAELMLRLAQSWGDQPYGAVLVANGALIGLGPSRVVQQSDPTAHAEREAIRDAQRRLGRTRLDGSVLYATSRRCRLCEAAAAQAHVARMFVGQAMEDAGAPKP